MDVATQRQEVNTWLESLFEPGQVPEYELNARTISHLHQLAESSLRSEKYTELVVQDLQQKTDEYYADAQRLNNVLSRLQLSQDYMSQLGTNCVKTLARLGLSLNVRDVSDTCYYLALQDLDDEIERIEKERHAEAKKLSMLVEKSQPIVQKSKALQKTLEMVKSNHGKQRSETEKQAESSAFFRSKCKSYAKEIQKLQERLSTSQVDESLYHETLVKKSEHLQSMQEKLSPLMAELQSYSSLPPDMAETKIKIEQQKRELKQLERELSDCISEEAGMARTGIS